LARLKAFRARHTESVKALCATDARLQNEKSALETAKTQAREQLDAHTSQVISAYGQRINHYLERVNAVSESRRRPTITAAVRKYELSDRINQHPVDLGDADTPHDRPSFRNHTERRDKARSALAFFSHSWNRPNRAVRLSYLTIRSAARTVSAGINLSPNLQMRASCAQVIVLSHERDF